MDAQTIKTYNTRAAVFAQEWEEEQMPPSDLQDAVKTYFQGGLTIDVGCGSGRDTAWLVEQGFDAIGIDASPGLLVEAERRHPSVHFEVNTLPELIGIGNGIYVNVLCETVIMHLLEPDAMAAIIRLTQLLSNGGTLYLSWRVTEAAQYRDNFGRLYANIQSECVRGTLADFDTLLDERIVSSSSGKVLHRMIVRRG